MQNSIRNWSKALSLGVFVALALQAALPVEPPAPGVNLSEVVMQEKTEEISGTLKAVNVNAKTLQVEGTDRQVKVTDATKFGAGLTLGDLKAGDKLRIVGVAKPTGEIEAREVHRVV